MSLGSFFFGRKSSDSEPKKIASYDTDSYKKTGRADRMKQIFSGDEKMTELAQVVEGIMGSRELLFEVADFILILDASGSMWDEYRDGKVQDIVNRAAVLGLQFDDNESISAYAYATSPTRLPSLTASNYRSYVKDVTNNLRGSTIVSGIGYENDEPLIMRMVIDDVKAQLKPGTRVRPRYVFFLTDGGVDERKSRLIENLIIESSELPIFWEFVGLGDQNYGALTRFDDLKGRKVDNSDFFKIDDYRRLSVEEFFGLMLTEYPEWQKKARAAGII